MIGSIDIEYPEIFSTGANGTLLTLAVSSDSIQNRQEKGTF